MIAWEMTDLPEPDSPTRATVPPSGTRKLTPSTARITPWRSSRNSIARSRTLRRSSLTLVAGLGGGFGDEVQGAQVGQGHRIEIQLPLLGRRHRPARHLVEAVETRI